MTHLLRARLHRHPDLVSSLIMALSYDFTINFVFIRALTIFLAALLARKMV